MAPVDDPKTLGRARLAFSDPQDIDEFVATLEKFERGEIGSDEWRAFRLLRGTYGQRRVKKLLADLEVMTPEMAQAEDFVDLAETEEFRPQTMDGECAS